MGWATFWEIFSETHLVTLLSFFATLFRHAAENRLSDLQTLYQL
jgi:hypothetical protein